MTPERFLYLINTTDKKVDYLFVDEAHKITTKDTRSAFYYDLIDKLSSMEKKPHIIFSSPNIPNPEIYLKMINGDLEKQNIHATYAPVCQMKYIINLINGSVKAYNDYSKEFITMSNANSSLDLTSIINHVARSKDQNIVYSHSLRETMNQAVIYTNGLPDLNNEELYKLSDEIKKEINSDYFLVALIRKGVAFHVGYLPASIRLRIENGFKNHIIRTLFCTSTLIEVVNLPADNLFFTTYKNGQSSLDSVSFRNLIGRVGRIDHALFGNVFMINLNKEDKVINKYEKLLQDGILNQQLSIENSLTSTQKKVIIESLKTADFEMKDKPEKTTEDEFDLMRKTALILMNNINDNKSSFVTSTLLSYGKIGDEEIIKNSTADLPKIIGLDVTPDQHISITKLIQGGLSYPEISIDGKIDYTLVLNFLHTLSKAFKWDVYEKKSLGNYNRLNLYASLLCKWMSGYGLNLIIKTSIDYHENNPEKGIYSNNWRIIEYYEYNNPEHINLAIADTLNTIENVILFSIANYFREFSCEYKKQHNLKFISNDWYEFVEYGTTNDLTITLQRYGYSREPATYILRHVSEFVDYSKPTDYATFSLNKSALENSRSDSVKSETSEIFVNVPELFI
ncbi:MAG TPA: hypothetical protein VJZ04_04800 [Lachnospiraceae bacterium]|nr:hypothetical protein [Lachnospiraceae bacterium]